LIPQENIWQFRRGNWASNPVFETEGWEFKPLRARQQFQLLTKRRPDRSDAANRTLTGRGELFAHIPSDAGAPTDPRGIPREGPRHIPDLVGLPLATAAARLARLAADYDERRVCRPRCAVQFAAIAYWLSLMG
jgi:hypothetical protein